MAENIPPRPWAGLRSGATRSTLAAILGPPSETDAAPIAGDVEEVHAAGRAVARDVYVLSGLYRHARGEPGRRM